ncbi:MAG: M15 family metallopeptidase [Synergistaceae bacterium]|nr:M15 family metallopeptidase [Synergistaceae bacterium]
MDRYRAVPLPPLKEVPDRAIPVAECGELLVPTSLYPSKILVRSWYFGENLPYSLPECYLREGAYERLVKAAESLPAGWRFVVWDGWRAPKLQAKLFEILEARIAKANPQLSSEEVKNKTAVFVAPPSTEPMTVSGHCTGGAVDLTIADDMGRTLEMGGLFDETTERSYSRHYEDVLDKNYFLADGEQKALENRRLLIHIMEEAGFSNYPQEWWHFDYGNRNWALRTGAPEARYGFIAPYAPWLNTEDKD